MRKISRHNSQSSDNFTRTLRATKDYFVDRHFIPLRISYVTKSIESFRYQILTTHNLLWLVKVSLVVVFCLSKLVYYCGKSLSIITH